MFIRRTAATMLVDATMALRTGDWHTVTRGNCPRAAIARLETLLAEPSTEDQVTDGVDALYAVIGRAVQAGELTIAGHEQFDLLDAHPALEIVAQTVAANDDVPLRKAA